MRPIPSHSVLRTRAVLILGVLLASCQGGPTGPDANIRFSTTSLEFSVGPYESPVTITNLGNASIEWRVTSLSASWVSVSPSTGTVGAKSSEVFTVKINRSAVPYGDHSAELQVTTGTRPHTLEVSLHDTGAPKAEFQPAALTIGPLNDSGIIEVANTGGSMLQWNLAPGAAWASVSPSNGSLLPGTSAQVVVSAHRTGLTKGNYVGRLYLTSNGGSPTAALSLEVGDGAGIHLEPSVLSFGLSSSSLPLTIMNQGFQTLNWSAVSGAEWLSLPTSSGQVPPQSSRSILVSVARTGLPHGLHQAVLRFSSNGGSAAINVMANAAPQGSSPSPSHSPPKIRVSPVSLNFGGTGTELPLMVLNEGDEPLAWSGSVDASWLTISPTSGQIAPHASGMLFVRVMRLGLNAGSYASSVRLESNGGSASAAVLATVLGPGGTPGPGPGPGPEPDPDPGPGPSGARISVEPTSLDFGSVTNERSVLVKNTGTGPLNWSAHGSHTWLALSTSSGSVPPGASQIFTVEARRAFLSAAGQYASSIQFSSNGGNANLPVSLHISAPSPPPTEDPPELGSIDATGATDVTDELNAYLATVPDGSTVHLPAGARYRAEGVVRIMKKSNFTIEGNGTVIFATSDGSGVRPPEDLKHLWPRQRSHVEISGGNNIVIRNLVVRGANPKAGSAEGAYVEPLEGQHGFDVRGVQGLLLERVTVTDTYGDLLYLASLSGVWAEDIEVRNAHLERSGRQGIAITGAENVIIRDSHLGEVGRTMIDLEPYSVTGGARNVQFLNNTFGLCRHLLLNSGGKGPNVNDIELIGNHLLGMQMQIRVSAADGSRRSGYRIVGNTSNTLLGASIPAIRMSRVDDIEISDNVQPMNPQRDMIGAFVCESTDVNIMNNVFSGAASEFQIAGSCPAEDS